MGCYSPSLDSLLGLTLTRERERYSPSSSVVKCLWGVFVGGLGCCSCRVCVCRCRECCSFAVCVCVCVCHLLIFLHGTLFFCPAGLLGAGGLARVLSLLICVVQYKKNDIYIYIYTYI